MNTYIKYRKIENLYELYDEETNVSYWLNKKLKLIRITRRKI